MQARGHLLRTISCEMQNSSCQMQNSSCLMQVIAVLMQVNTCQMQMSSCLMQVNAFLMQTGVPWAWRGGTGSRPAQGGPGLNPDGPLDLQRNPA